MPVQPEDLTARARIREAAIELFANDGVDATSMRSIAAKAKVSPSLVVHHFKSKSGLRQAVDDAVLTAFQAAITSVDISGSGAEVSERLNRAVASIIGGEQSVRDYLGRSLFEATDASQQLFDALIDLATNGFDELERAGVVRTHTDPTWRAYNVMFVVLGPIMLSRQLQARLGTDPFDPAVVARRSATNIDILQHGLFTS